MAASRRLTPPGCTAVRYVFGLPARDAPGVISGPVARTLAVLGVYNLVQNLLVSDAAYVPMNAVVTAWLVRSARRSGAGWDDLGLAAARMRRGLAAGSPVALATGLVVVGLSHRPPGLSWFADERVVGDSRGRARYRTLVRFPVGTAVFEEVAFRGVLHGLVRRRHGAGMATMVGSVAFGLWHVVPTWRTLRHTAAGRRLPPGSGAQVASMAGGVVITALGGVALACLRERSGSVLAPWLVHAVLNSSTYLASRRAMRMGAGDLGLLR